MFEYHKKRLLGKKFGKLTVVDCYGTDARDKTLWLCLCECGGNKVVRNDSLRRGSTKSCGCLGNRRGNLSPTWKGFGEIPGFMWYRILRDARESGRPVGVTFEQIWELFLDQGRKCALSGIDLKFPAFRIDYSSNASLDRIDSNKGYVHGNIQWIDKRINFMKQEMPQAEFLQLCNQITNFQRGISLGVKPVPSKH